MDEDHDEQHSEYSLLHRHGDPAPIEESEEDSSIDSDSNDANGVQPYLFEPLASPQAVQGSQSLDDVSAEESSDTDSRLENLDW